MGDKHLVSSVLIRPLWKEQNPALLSGFTFIPELGIHLPLPCKVAGYQRASDCTGESFQIALYAPEVEALARRAVLRFVPLDKLQTQNPTWRELGEDLWAVEMADRCKPIIRQSISGMMEPMKRNPPQDEPGVLAILDHTEGVIRVVSHVPGKPDNAVFRGSVEAFEKARDEEDRAIAEQTKITEKALDEWRASVILEAKRAAQAAFFRDGVPFMDSTHREQWGQQVARDAAKAANFTVGDLQ
jgi:hypothetical protein